MLNGIFLNEPVLIPSERLIESTTYDSSTQVTTYILTAFGCFLSKNGYQTLATGYTNDSGADCCMVFTLD